MGIYHITYTPGLKEICLYFNGNCQFSCYGCVTDYYPADCHLTKHSKFPVSLCDIQPKQQLNKSKILPLKRIVSYLEHLSFKRIIFLGKEPTIDKAFLPLAGILKQRFLACNVLLTNGWEYVNDRVLNEICVSIKAVSKNIFKHFTGRDSSSRVLRNFRKYINNPYINVRAESIFIPGYIGAEEIEKIAKFISSVDPMIPYRIDGYMPHKNDKFRGPTREEIEKIKSTAGKYLKNVSTLHYGMKTKYKVERIY